jgi:hypothetical protein
VGRVLPDLERLAVIQRADERTLARLAERLQEVPGTVVYELCNVVPGAEEVREPDDERDIDERLADIEPDLSPLARKKAVVAVLRKWMGQRTGREIEFPWLIKLYEKAGNETALVSAARATLQAKPQGSVLGYMTKVLNNRADPVAAAHMDLSSETAKRNGGW